MTAHDPRDVAARIGAMVGLDRARVANPLHGQLRLADQAARVASVKARAMPPLGMAAAPVAPARGPMTLAPLHAMQDGGTRRLVGVGWRATSILQAMVDQAARRHEARFVRPAGLSDDDAKAAMAAHRARFAAPFTPGQIAVAADYRGIVEWREGSALRCASLEAGRGGGGSGMYIDSFIDQCAWLAELRRRIGDGVAMDIRRHMDRGNARRAILVRVAVDQLVLGDVELGAILAGHGWTPDGKNRKVLRGAVCGALDRMQGYGG